MNEADAKAELIAYCRANDRVCPTPMKWNDLYKLLPDTRRIGNGWEPALPLILGAWHEASDSAKQLRLEEHVAWANDQGAIEVVDGFLRGLDESDWYHIND